ncbi:MAG: DNA polymerase III subunit delta [Planctomycetota bacterium]|jgi:DNA polymerase-3 subunit delta
MAKKSISAGEYYAALKKLTQGELPPVTVIYHGQDYFRRKALLQLEKAARKKKPEISLISFQGPSSNSESQLNVNTILEELTNYGLFASEKMVVIKRAARFLFPRKAGGDEEGGAGQTSGDIDKLIEYIINPVAGMYLVIELDNIDKRRSAGKALMQNSAVIECPELRWDREVTGWIMQDIKSRGHSISSAAADMLFVVYGADPGVISGELDKLCIFAGNIPQITEDDVREFMGDSIALTGFEIVNAIEDKDVRKAVTAARQLVKQGVADQRGKRADLVGSVHMALGGIRGCLVRIWQSHQVVAAGGSLRDVESKMRVSGRRAEVIYKAGRKFNTFDLKKAFNMLSVSLENLHGTGSDPALELEKLVLGICS